MGKKGFKVKTYEPPDEKFVVVVNAWGKTRDRQQFANAVGAWFEVMLRRIHPKQKLQVNCIYYQSTHDILIVELPSTVTSLSPFLGAHPYRSFLTTHPTSTEFTYVYEYNFRHFNHPENTNWHASAPSYRELPRTLPVKDPYPLPREIEGIGMLPTPPPPMNAKYAIPVPVPVPLPPPSAPIQETRCSPAPAPPPRPSASSSGSSSTTSTLPREHGSDSRTLDPRGRAPSSTPAPAPPQPPPASPSTTDSLFTPYDPPSHHPAHSNLTTARPSGAGKGKERELLAQLQPRSSISTASSGTVDDFLSSILPPPSQPPPRAPPLVRVKTEETLVKLEDEDHVEAVRVKPEPRDDHDPALFASPPPPTHYPSPTARPLRIKAEPLDDSIPERPSAVSWGIQVKPEPSEAEEGAMAALRMPPPPLPTRVKTEPIDDEDIDLGPATAATPTSSRAAGYVRSQSEMWVKQELLLDPSRMRRSESVFGQPESKDVYDPESEERRAGDQEDEREERPGDQEDDYQPSAELLDAFASLEGELGFDLFGATGMEVDSSSQTAASVAESPGKVTVKLEPRDEEDRRAYMDDFSDRRSAPSTTPTLASETRSVTSSSRKSDASDSTRALTRDPRQTPLDPRRRITLKEEPRDESPSVLLHAPTSHRQQSTSTRRMSIGGNQRHRGREGERERSLTMPGSSSGSSRDGRELVKIKPEPRDDTMIDFDRRSTTRESHNQSSLSYGDPRRTTSRRDRSESDPQRERRSTGDWRSREDNAGRKRGQDNDPYDGFHGGGARGVDGKDEKQGSSWSGLKFKRLKREPA